VLEGIVCLGWAGMGWDGLGCRESGFRLKGRAGMDFFFVTVRSFSMQIVLGTEIFNQELLI